MNFTLDDQKCVDNPPLELLLCLQAVPMWLHMMLTCRADKKFSTKKLLEKAFFGLAGLVKQEKIHI